MSTTVAPEPKTEDIVRYDIRAARLKSGLRQYELAERLGITRAYLSDLERHIYVPSPELFAKICRFTKTPPSAYVYLDTPA